MDILQQKKDKEESVGNWKIADANRDAKAMFTNACSARLFSDFDVTKPLSSWPVFAHENCCRDRMPKQMQFSVKPVEDQILREMCHKIKNHEHNGQIAACRKCSKYFSINGIIDCAECTPWQH